VKPTLLAREVHWWSGEEGWPALEDGVRVGSGAEWRGRYRWGAGGWSRWEGIAEPGARVSGRRGGGTVHGGDKH